MYLSNPFLVLPIVVLPQPALGTWTWAGAKTNAGSLFVMFCQEHCFLPGTHRPWELRLLCLECLLRLVCSHGWGMQGLGGEALLIATFQEMQAGDLCAWAEVQPFLLCNNNSLMAFTQKPSYAIIVSVGFVRSKK